MQENKSGCLFLNTVFMSPYNKRTKISALVLHCLHGWRTRCFAEKIYQVRGMAWIDSETKKNGFQLRRMIEASARHLAGIIKVVICWLSLWTHDLTPCYSRSRVSRRSILTTLVQPQRVSPPLCPSVCLSHAGVRWPHTTYITDDNVPVPAQQLILLIRHEFDDGLCLCSPLARTWTVTTAMWCRSRSSRRHLLAS